MNTEPAMPGDTHPAYEASRPAIVAWLDNPTGYPYRDHMLIAFPRITWELDMEEGPTARPRLLTRTLTRRTAYGPAPYVGRPFVYQWYVGEDDLGRMVAGRWTWTRHTEGEAEYMIRTGDTEGPWSRLSRPVDGEPGWPVQAVP